MFEYNQRVYYIFGPLVCTGRILRRVGTGQYKRRYWIIRDGTTDMMIHEREISAA